MILLIKSFIYGRMRIALLMGDLHDIEAQWSPNADLMTQYTYRLDH